MKLLGGHNLSHKFLGAAVLMEHRLSVFDFPHHIYSVISLVIAGLIHCLIRILHIEDHLLLG